MIAAVRVVLPWVNVPDSTNIYVGFRAVKRLFCHDLCTLKLKGYYEFIIHLLIWPCRLFLQPKHRKHQPNQDQNQYRKTCLLSFWGIWTAGGPSLTSSLPREMLHLLWAFWRGFEPAAGSSLPLPYQGNAHLLWAFEGIWTARRTVPDLFLTKEMLIYYELLRNWTLDLFLTKEVLYHWATKAISIRTSLKLIVRKVFKLSNVFNRVDDAANRSGRRGSGTRATYSLEGYRSTSWATSAFVFASLPTSKLVRFEAFSPPPPPPDSNCGGGWIRTLCVGIHQQI